MGRRLRILAAGVAAVGALGLLGVGLLAGAGATALRGCGAFEAQGDAQEYFLEHDGTPHRNVGHMDGDHDGVACEMLGAPYVGYATIGYNRRKHFLYGTATMPPGSPAPAEPPCLTGNTHYPKGPRRLEVYRVTPQGDKAVFGRQIAAEARPGSDRLLWKRALSVIAPGTYYAEFDEKVRLAPYGRNECPGFSSRPTRLPVPRGRPASSPRR